MAWYAITYKCGHEGREQIYGTNVHGEREAMGLVCRIQVNVPNVVLK